MTMLSQQVVRVSSLLMEAAQMLDEYADVEVNSAAHDLPRRQQRAKDYAEEIAGIARRLCETDASSPTEALTFDALRAANIARLPQFRNKHGDLAHKAVGTHSVDGSDWSPAQWLQAVVGELGEYANLRKKHERGDVDTDEFRVEAGKELADVTIYLDILAKQLGIDLGVAVVSKFNEVSRRVGADVFLASPAAPNQLRST